MIIFTKNQYNEIVDYSISELPNEACGLLGGIIDENNKKIIKKIYLLENVDKSPMHFSLDVNDQFRVIADIRKNGWCLIGNFHSHPQTPSRPSEEDIRLAFDQNLSYIILSLSNKKEPVINSFLIKDKDILKEELVVLE